MLRFELSETGQPALPAIDLADGVVTIGSGEGARIRLPAAVARDAHVRIEGATWRAIAEVVVDGARCAAGETGAIGAGVTLELGAYRVRVMPAPAGAIATPPQRTESLARELVRGLLGDGAGPTLEVERGPLIGARRMLAPPESTLVIGRGDEATWVIVDEDLSRTHAEVRRGWDGMRIVDLGSKNGTRVDGVAVGDGVALHDGALIELGKIAIRFRDPAERHLRGAPVVVAPPQVSVAASRRRAWPFWSAVAIAVVATAGLVWVLAS